MSDKTYAERFGTPSRPDGCPVLIAAALTKVETENAALRADIHAHEQINKQLIEDKRRLDFMEQNIDFISWRFYGKPQPFDLRGTIDAKRKEAKP